MNLLLHIPPSKPVVPNLQRKLTLRGTLSILWTNLFTIIACTWSIQHLDVPEQRLGRDPGWRGDFKWKMKGIWRTTKWMLITIIAPEIVLIKAVFDVLVAKSITERLKDIIDQDEVPWTFTHSLLAVMGGFAIEYGEENHHASISHLPNDYQMHPLDEGSASRFSMSHGEQTTDSDEGSASQSSTRRRELELPRPWTIRNRKDTKVFMQGRKTQRNLIHLSADELFELRHAGVLHKLPAFSEDDINDKSTSDSFAKAVAVGQILWSTVQVIVRASRHVPITQLELAVTAFSACAVAIYALNWKKPKDVQVPYVILRYKTTVPENVLEHLYIKRDRSTLRLYSGLPRASIKTIIRKRLSGSPIPNDYSGRRTWWSEKAETFGQIGITIVTSAFGALHIAAWNTAFPTRIEQIIWRVASIYITASIPVYGSLGSVAVFFSPRVEGFLDNIFLFINIGVPFIYAIARLFLLVEIFRTLYFLPPGAYISTWTKDIPHFG